ncbi:MerR family DNA-binding transcriptional regulator [Thalassospira sp. TSL5-1]|uniref:MerR family DNA-binding transcriptional regulator n=1 Tax=Thalassospira sp. TSL5-1 TaxID=1544451 RepID=UPI0011610250|nr:MerR family DNA-binding transcriptional regulator [Thalassospira sp. TSL5-1]
MKIGDLAKRSGLSAHTLRYYERIGLLPYADPRYAGLCQPAQWRPCHHAGTA